MFANGVRAECNFPNPDFNITADFCCPVGSCSLLLWSAHLTLTSLLSASFSFSCLHLLCSPAGEGQTEAPHVDHSPLRQMAQPCWKHGFPISTYSSVCTTITVFTLSRIFSPRLPIFPSVYSQVHFCICFVEGSIIRGCHISLLEIVSCTAGLKGLERFVDAGGSPSCTQPRPFHRIEVLYMDYFFPLLLFGDNKNSPYFFNAYYVPDTIPSILHYRLILTLKYVLLTL